MDEEKKYKGEEYPIKLFLEEAPYLKRNEMMDIFY